MATAVAALLGPLSTWLYRVTSTVNEPYLDEVFHVRQAQNYCNGRFDIWDPKITTPPGLYLMSWVVSKASLKSQLGFKNGYEMPLFGCNLTVLRAGNAAGLVLLMLAVRASYMARATTAAKTHPGFFEHSALNTVLFPPLFFFSALYYTDVWSTLLVLLYYMLFLNTCLDGVGHTRRFITLVPVGLATLAFRQTNIFWVAILPAGLVLFRQVDEGHQAVKNSMYRRVEGFGDSIYSIAKTSWKMQVVYDQPVRDAWVDDYLKTTISVAACSLKVITQPRLRASLLLALAPYLTLLASFAAFILWNGGVVLGDKSNHIATLHMPQMLYLWPFISFFSWPLIYPYVLLLPVFLLARAPMAFATLESIQLFKRSSLLPRIGIALAAIALACAAVLGQTIVHPFTLADNRHYMFYVFRHLLRPWWMRYATTPIYVLSGWACVQSLGGGPPAMHAFDKNASGARLPVPNGQHSATTSFALIWVATSALQLVTAPLVEPRYFILPWIFWRMHLPLRVPPEESSATEASAIGNLITRLWEDYDHRLWVETVWLLTVNAVTGYIFLYWGFYWPQEPGQVQRFMW